MTIQMPALGLPMLPPVSLMPWLDDALAEPIPISHFLSSKLTTTSRTTAPIATRIRALAPVLPKLTLDCALEEGPPAAPPPPPNSEAQFMALLLPDDSQDHDQQ